MSLDASPAQSDREVYLAAIDIADQQQRRAFLDQACRGNPQRRGNVERLLAAREVDRPNRLERAIKQLCPEKTTSEPMVESLEVDISSHPTIDHYKLLEQIGEGGMGTVFMVQQNEPIRRKVALKLIKAGMDSREVIARFQAERQALAMMDHPNIARVLDAGTTAQGRPYFVMELVRGIPITDYCDHEKLSVDDRLRLFIDVCRAVQHAHQKGIIHRDLKPSNVMVTLHDGTPVVKVIDFGVAKALNQELSERTLFTKFSQMIGTPLYVSPEQAEMSGLDVDTRSDIYSLGVLLYELLTGTTPFDSEKLKAAGFDEMRRIICEQEPPRPSHTISTLEAQLLSTVSDRRKTDPRQLWLSMRQELDWITMKALEKDRNRRYATANALATDVQRYLDDEPVTACPPSAAYRLRKFARRNKTFLGTAATVATALLVAAGLSLWQAVEATAARDLAKAAATAEAEARREAEANEREAEARRDEIAAVLKFVEERVFSAARPEGQEGGLGRGVRLGEAIAAALPYLEAELPDQPLIEARLRKTLGISFRYLGEAEAARQQHERAHDLYSSQLGPDHPDTLSSTHNLANSFHAVGRLEEALELREETLERRQAKLGPDHPDTLTSMNNLALSYSALGRHEEALALREETLALRKGKLGPDHPDTLGSMQNLANSYHALGWHEEALALREETLALQKAKLGPDHPDTLSSMQNLANSYHALGRHKEALALREETLELQKAKLGPDHPDTLGSMQNLANSYHALGRLEEALALREEALELWKAKLGPDHPHTLRSMQNLANSYHALGQLEDALALWEETLELRKAKLGSEHPDTLTSMNSLANSYHALGRNEEALALREETLELQKAKLGSDHPDTLSSMNNLATSYHDLGRLEEALALNEETLERRQAKLGPDHPDTLNSANALSAVAFILATHADVNQRDANRAVELARIGVELHPTSPKNWNHLGVALCRADQWQESVEAFERADGMIDDGDRAFRMFLAMAHWQLGNKEKARQRYAEGAAWIAAHRSEDEEQKRFRADAEQLLGLSEADRSAMIAEFYAATEIDDASALIDRGRWHQANDDHEKAVEDFTAALRLQPETRDFTVWRSRGLAYYALEQYEQAVSDFSNAIELNADDMWSMKTRGWAYQRLGQLDSALSDLTTCIQRKPSVRYHYVQRASILRDRGEFEAALVDCEKAIAIDPDNDAPYFRRSEAYVLRGDIYADDLQQYDQAVQEYEKALQLDPQNAVFSEKRDRAQQAAVDFEPSVVSPQPHRPTADTT